jgi:hypothetical protein
MEERTTQELIITLDDDYDRCYRNILQSFDDGTIDEDGNLDADYEFHARQLMRAVFAYIEGLTFSVKLTAANECIQRGIEISPAERYMAAEVEYELNEKGKVVERPARPRLAQSIRFAFALTEKAQNVTAQFDASGQWWSCLKQAIRVRDRLMHPRMPQDLDVSPDELLCAINAKQGFDEILHRYISLRTAQ